MKEHTMYTYIFGRLSLELSSYYINWRLAKSWSSNSLTSDWKSLSFGVPPTNLLRT